MTEKKSTNIGYKITIILLSIIILWLIYEKVSSYKEEKQLISQIEMTTQGKDSLRSELSDLYDSYDDLQTNNEVINDSLSRQQVKIKKLMDEIAHVKANDYARIQQLKKEVATLKKVMKSFVHQIDSLYQENQILLAENTEIKNNYDNVVHENEALEGKTDSLEQTVSVAKELTVYNTVVSALNKRGKATNRISKADKFQICFNLSENKVASVGRKNIYLRITKPTTGEVLRNSGSDFFEYQGKSISYSSVKEIEYNGSAQNVCMFYNVEIEGLEKGKYHAFIFVDGVQVGDEAITMN